MGSYTNLFKYLGKKDKVFRGEKTSEKSFRGEKFFGEKNTGVFRGEKDMNEIMGLLRDIDLYIVPINVSKYTKRYKNKEYTYTRKRVELPPGFNDKVAVVLTRQNFEKLLNILSKALGVEIDQNKIRELLNI